jgi:hypothetical protein
MATCGTPLTGLGCSHLVDLRFRAGLAWFATEIAVERDRMPGQRVTTLGLLARSLPLRTLLSARALVQGDLAAAWTRFVQPTCYDREQHELAHIRKSQGAPT